MLAIVVAASAILLASAPSQAHHPKWTLVCDSDNGCTYVSDGDGENGGYPVRLNMETLEISVKPLNDDKCVWQWKLIGGQWRWVCVLITDGSAKGK
jgi:hypothetical protein